MPATEPERCSTCRYWSPFAQTLDTVPVTEGLCRRYPAECWVQVGVYNRPVMAADEWCGEWEPREDA